MARQPNPETKIHSAAYKANAALHDLRAAIHQTTDEEVRQKLNRTCQVLSLIVDQLDDLTPPFG